MTEQQHVGSDFDDFLRDEGLFDLVCAWADSYSPGYSETHYGYEQVIAENAVKWAYEQHQQENQAAADAELKACCEWLEQNCGRWEIPASLRAARRPKPPTLAEQALEVFEALICDNAAGLDVGIIRAALERLTELETLPNG